MQSYWNKIKCLQKKRVETPQDWFDTLTRLPFTVLKQQYGYHNIMCICPKALNHKAWHFQGGEKSKENGSYESHDALQPLICTWINVKRLHDKHTWSHNMARTNKPNRQPSIIKMTVWILKNQFTLYKIMFTGICKGSSRDKSLSSTEIYHVTIRGFFKYIVCKWH